MEADGKFVLLQRKYRKMFFPSFPETFTVTYPFISYQCPYYEQSIDRGTVAVTKPTRVKNKYNKSPFMV